MTDIKWQEPPAPRSGGSKGTKWRDIGAALRKRPGKWALVLESGSASNATQIKRGTMPGLGPGFDARVSGRPDGKYDVYARFVGE